MYRLVFLVMVATVVVAWDVVPTCAQSEVDLDALNTWYCPKAREDFRGHFVGLRSNYERGAIFTPTVIVRGEDGTLRVPLLSPDALTRLALALDAKYPGGFRDILTETSPKGWYLYRSPPFLSESHTLSFKKDGTFTYVHQVVGGMDARLEPTVAVDTGTGRWRTGSLEQMLPAATVQELRNKTTNWAETESLLKEPAIGMVFPDGQVIVRPEFAVGGRDRSRIYLHSPDIPVIMTYIDRDGKATYRGGRLSKWP